MSLRALQGISLKDENLSEVVVPLNSHKRHFRPRASDIGHKKRKGKYDGITTGILSPLSEN